MNSRLRYQMAQMEKQMITASTKNLKDDLKIPPRVGPRPIAGAQVVNQNNVARVWHF